MIILVKNLYMNKLLLIGGKGLTNYSVADLLWKSINNLSDVKFNFSMLEVESEKDLMKFISKFNNDIDIIGFNVALPWKSVICKYVDTFDHNNIFPKILNTVYKKNNKIHGSNTDIIGAQKSLTFSGCDIQNVNSILILGIGGVGFALSIFYSNLSKKVYCYDINSFNTPRRKNIKILKNLNDVEKIKYDLIINATPLGKYYFNNIIQEFSSPINVRILRNISKKDTILQEINYFPEKTFFLELGEMLNLKIVPGILVLIFQAFASYELYFNCKLNENLIYSILYDHMLPFLNTRETKVFNFSF